MTGSLVEWLATALAIVGVAAIEAVKVVRARRRERQLTAQAAQDAHNGALGEHRCCRLTLGPGREPGYQCGQYCGHRSDCTWFVPGEYLPPPLLRALDPRGIREQCPVCGSWVNSVGVEDALWWLRDEGWSCAYAEPTPGATFEALWRFGPCGCEAREILHDTASTDASP